MSVKIDTSDWVEVRCNHCDAPKLLFKLTVENLNDLDTTETKKLGFETKCRHCKNLTYRTLVV